MWLGSMKTIEYNEETWYISNFIKSQKTKQSCGVAKRKHGNIETTKIHWNPQMERDQGQIQKVVKK